MATIRARKQSDGTIRYAVDPSPATEKTVLHYERQDLLAALGGKRIGPRAGR